MSVRERARPGLGIIEPCLPSPAKVPPSGPGWIHEIKHDGFRILARRDGVARKPIRRLSSEPRPEGAGCEARSGKGLGPLNSFDFIGIVIVVDDAENRDTD